MTKYTRHLPATVNVIKKEVLIWSTFFCDFGNLSFKSSYRNLHAYTGDNIMHNVMVGRRIRK